MASTIVIEDTITVGDLADRLMIPVTKLIGELMKVGVMVTVNERIDFETAEIITNELGLDISLEKQEAKELTTTGKDREELKGSKTKTRPPVVAVMGHVDHGKTSLLDAIRDSQVAKHEAGGITQHISAYQIKHGDREITFLDTPGHEAFAAIREHGALLTDLVIIVVAADDGVKPQTVEAIRFAKKAKVKIIVAINKIDKTGADPNRTKQQLAENDVLVEGFGGDVVVVEVSAKERKGIDALLDMVILLADLEDLKAYTDVPAYGLVIESHMEKGRGPVAEVLVQGGILRRGDFIVAGSSYAHIRNLESSDNKPITTAEASTPAIITGFKNLPNFGEQFQVVKGEKNAKTLSGRYEIDRQKANSKVDISSSELLRIISHSNKLEELNILIKADVQGSLVSVMDSLKSLNTEEVAVRIIASGVGVISENDIHMAQSAGAIIYAFNVNTPKNIEQLARRFDVVIRSYQVIYELIDDAREELSKLLQPQVVVTKVASLTIKGIFKQTKTTVICGGEVTEGKLSIPSNARLMRGEELLAEVGVINLKRGPQDVKEVPAGEMCGLSLKTEAKVDIKIDDVLEVYKNETIERNI